MKGDTNLDGAVNDADLLTLLKNYVRHHAMEQCQL